MEREGPCQCGLARGRGERVRERERERERECKYKTVYLSGNNVHVIIFVLTLFYGDKNDCTPHSIIWKWPHPL